MNIQTMRKYLFAALLLIGSLFLFACYDYLDSPCAHINMAKTVIPPTHDTEGKTEYSCSDCNEYSYFVELVPPLGHTLVQTVHEPDCTNEGYTEYSCECGYEYTSDFITPLGHELTAVLTAPSCDTEGYTQYSCSCGYSYRSDFVEPLGHTFTETVVAPSCDTEGYTVAECSVCRKHYTHDIKAPLGHDFTVTRGYVSVQNGSAATHYKCSRCTLDYDGDFLLYRDIYTGAYVDNTVVLSRGIDVSKWNHNVASDGSYLPLDWSKIKAAEYDFVILRAGYMDETFVIDPVFEMNYEAAKAAGLAVGAYIYSYAYSVDDAHIEAEELLKALLGKQFEYPIFFDIEYSDEKIAEKGLTPRTITDICIEFISTMQENGYFTALYTNNKWLTEHLIKDEVTELFDIWYARYLYAKDDGISVNEATWNTEKYGTQMAMWQFSETGNIEGIYKIDGTTPTDFDMNYCYKDYTTLIKQYGLNGFDQPADN